MVSRLALLGCLSGPLCVGCQNSAERQSYQAVIAYHRGQFDDACQLLDPLAKQTNGDFVLNNDRLGSAALAAGNIPAAQDAFLRSYEVINSVGVNNGGRSLGTVVLAENIRVWEGEPFERAMVNFYLGLCYYMQHDYNNARAAFQNALFKLRDYGDKPQSDKYQDVQSNFALGYLMLAKCWQRLGDEDQASAMYQLAVKYRPDLSALANLSYNADANLLLVVDWGEAPLKATSADGSVVGFVPAPWQAGPIFTPYVTVDGQGQDEGVFRPPVDLVSLAQDRRWQTLDTIRALKSAAGTGLMAAGVIEGMQGRQSNAELGAGLFLAGLLLKATSQADVRQWEMLPRTSFVIPLHVSPGMHRVRINFPGLSESFGAMVAPEKDDNTYYVRMNPYNNGLRPTPNDVPGQTPPPPPPIILPPPAPPAPPPNAQ